MGLEEDGKSGGGKWNRSAPSKGGKKNAYHLVHRLDKDTTGVLLVAKGARIAQFIGEAFKSGDVVKTYWAIVEGTPPMAVGEINAPLLKKGFGNHEKMAVDFKDGKQALTHFRLIKQLKEPGDRSKKMKSWLELTPVTGRTHQLRVHCTYMGYPIIGDPKYGDFEKEGPLFLHARSLKFRDPEGTIFTFVAPPPFYFEEWMRANKVDFQKI